MRRLLATPTWAVLAVLVGVSAALRFWAAYGIPVPWIAPDEMIYGTLGQSLYREGELEILGGPTPLYSLVYPALSGVVLAIDDLELGYTLLKALQALVMSVVAVPVYLWGRRLASRGWALLAAALSISIPGLAYSGLIMTEVAFYPVMTVAAWAMACALERPTPRLQALLVALIGVAVSTRLQAIVLLPVLITALGLKALFDRSTLTVVRFWPTLAGLGGLAILWSAWRLRDGGPWTRIFAGYQAAGEADYGLSDAAEFVAYHIGDALLLSGIFPACAVALLLVAAAAGRERSEAARAYLAVTAALFGWLVLQVGTFASRHVDRLAERDLLTLAPLLFIGFAVWLDRGGPRPRLETSLVSLAAAVPVLSLPVKTFINEGALPDAFTLVPFYRLLTNDPSVNLEVVVFGAATAAAGIFALVPRRLVVVLPIVLLAAFGAASVDASRYVRDQARLQQRKLVGPERRWVDRVAAGPVGYLFDGDFYWNAVWEVVFWNRKVKFVYSLPGAHVPGPLPQKKVNVLPDGRLVNAQGRQIQMRYMIASTSFVFAGGPVAFAAQEGIDQSGLNLWRPTPPVRLLQARSGVRPSGEIRGGARTVAYACTRGAWKLTLIAARPLRAEVRQNGRLVKVRSRKPHDVLYFRPGERWAGSIPGKPQGRPPDATCTLEVFASDLLYTSRFHYQRAEG